MNYSRTALSDAALLKQLDQSFARDRANMALLLADISEVDARKLYLPAGYSSMHAYCVEGFGLSKDSAYKRIQAARTARSFPEIFVAVADGRLNLSGVCLLAPHLAPGNASELIAAAAGKSKCEIEAVIARRFPRSEEMPMVETLPTATWQLAPGQVEAGHVQPSDLELVPGQVLQGSGSKVVSVADQRFALHVTLSERAHDCLRHAQSLLGHQIPSGDLAAVLERVLEVAVRQLERRKFGSTERPGKPRRGSSRNPRYIPPHVKRAVWERDGGRCTFVSADGHRCSERTRLEFDHVDPVARGGQTTVSVIRLCCRAHNQYAAERAFGTDFMSSKREMAREAAEARRREAEEERARTLGRTKAEALAKERVEEVVPWLQALGIRACDARKAAERCASVPDAPLEERLKVALSCFGPAKQIRLSGPLWRESPK